jgi:hypothetical protein
MAIFKYTLPSGAAFTLDATEGTTQAQADKIFYEQVAAGTFVGYNPGDKLTHPKEALTNFGLTRLQRGTAGVDDQTLLAVVSGLPIVAELPPLTTVPIQNPINQADYIQITSSPQDGVYSLGPVDIGQLSPVQVQAVMAQTAAVVDQPSTEATVEKGVGKFGFSAVQLERAGYIKPGYTQMYSPINKSTQQNNPNLVDFLSTPSPWTGKNGIKYLNDVTTDEATQNQIQQELMQQSYDQLVKSGVIIPPTPAVTTPSASTGQVYDTTGTLVQASALTLVAASLGFNGSKPLFSDFTNLFKSASGALSTANISGTFSQLSTDPIGTVSDAITNLGPNAVADYTASVQSLATGAVGFVKDAANSVSQLSGLATGLADANAAVAATTIASTLNGDVGALIANSTKYGAAITTAWAQGSNTLSSLGTSISNINTESITKLGDQALVSAGVAVDTIKDNIKSGLDILGKASQFSINFSDFSLSSLVAGVQPAAAFNNTVNRATIDAAFTRIIGSEKIATPTFEVPSLASLGIEADIAKAKSLLGQATTLATNVQNQVVQVAGAATSAINNAQNQAASIIRRTI